MVSRRHPHGARRPRQPRRGRRSRLGHAGRRRCRGREDRGQAVHASARVVVNEGDVISLDGTTGEVVLGEMNAGRRRAAGRVRHDPRVGRRDPQGQARRARQRRHRRGRRQRPRVRRRRHRPVPHRAHVPRARPPAGRARDDPGRHAPPRKTLRSTSCGRVQQTDFEEILEAMDGLPVTVRLLDPPLHEFLPSVEELRVKQATRALTDARSRRARARPRTGREHNPMIGTRGVRLGVVKPGLTRCRCEALMAAAAVAAQAGQEPDRRDHDPADRHP